MFSESRIEIYDYIYHILHGTVSENVYDMRAPQELTESDTQNGFLVVYVGSFEDYSEFSRQAYGRVRCFVEAYIPQISRGRVNREIYTRIENAINEAIEEETQKGDGIYYIENDSLLSSDGDETSNAGNAYFTFIKSFIVTTDKQD